MIIGYIGITKTDFTNFGPYLMVFCMVLFLFGIVLIFWRNEVAHLIYACLAALLFSVYLIFDTQMILGRGQFSYGLDDAYFAAMQLYTDIVQLFLQILQILTAIDR
jgi:FtsH-binding integral membrane protein